MKPTRNEVIELPEKWCRNLENMFKNGETEIMEGSDDAFVRITFDDN